MAKTLKQRAEEIRNETEEGANTAKRVGRVLVDIVDRIEGEEGLTKQVQDLKQKMSEFIGFTYIENVDFPAEGGTVRIGVKTTCKEWEVT